MQAFRGIVINPEFKSLGPEAFSVDPSSMPDLLRQCLLYWDRIDWPSNNLVYVDGGPEMEFLRSSGVLQRTHVHVRGAFSGDITPLIAQNQLAVFTRLEAAEPGCWSIGQGGGVLRFPGQTVAERRAVEVELYEALPVPAQNVPFEDVLEFRQHYASELQALRATLDDLYAEILTSDDPARTHAIVVTKLKAGIDDVERAMDGRRLSRWRTTCAIELSSRNITLGLLAGAGVAAPLGMPIGLAAAAGALVGGLLNVNVACVPTPKLVRTGPFAYLYRAKRELR